MKLMFVPAVFLLLLQMTYQAVIGIDLGSNFYKISLIAPGKTFVIVESMSTKRKVNTALSFVNKKRQYDADANNKKIRFSANSFTFVQKFLGALEENKEVFEVSKEYFEDYVSSFDDKYGTVKFELQNFKFDEQDDEDETIVLRVEEVLAMILKYAKGLADKMGKVDIKDCVITVPTHWGFAQKDALLTAVDLSGLHALSLISENTAAGLYYAVERVDDVPHTVMFYNIGATNLQVSLIEYVGVSAKKPLANNNTSNLVESVNVLADVSIPNVGGRAYDKVIVDYFAEKIDAMPSRKGKKSITQNRRAMRKMMAESVKTKEILSANKDALYYSESLIEGNDYNGQISRQEFEERSQPLLDQLLKPIDIVLERANKTLENVDIIELIGGGTRIPKIQQILKEKVGELELGTHMNGDEAMALGASYHAANYSRSFRVRDVLLSDGLNYEIKAQISNLEETSPDSEDYYFKNFTLFGYKKRFGTKKAVSLSQSSNLKIKLFTKDYDGNENEYAQFNLTNVEKIRKDPNFNENSKPKVSMEFEINSVDGIVLNDAQCRFNFTVEEKLDEEDLKRIDKDRERAKKRFEKDQEKAKKDAEKDKKNVEEEVAKVQLKWEEPELFFRDEKDGESVKNVTYTYKTKSRNVNVDIKEQYFSYKPWGKSDFKKSQRLIKRFDLYEERQRNLSDIKNKFESFVYQVRDWVVDEHFLKFSQEQEIEKLTNLREANQEWLETDEAYSGNFTLYQGKLKEMEDLAFPPIRRYDEARQRQAFINKTVSEIDNYQKKLAVLERDHKWLNETSIGEVRDIINETVEWLKSSIEKQNKQAINEDPVFSIQELKPKIDEISKVYYRIKAIKEPKAQKDKKPKTKLGKQKIMLDGEEVEVDFDELKKDKEFKDFDFKKFQENLKKQEQQKKKEKKEENNEQNEEVVEENEQEEEVVQEEEQQNEEKGDL